MGPALAGQRGPSHMDEWRKGVNERIAAESSKSDLSIDDEMRIIQQENAINPVIV